MMQMKQKWLLLALFLSVVIGVAAESIPQGNDEEGNDTRVLNLGTRTRSTRKLKKSKSDAKKSTCAFTYEEIDEISAIEATIFDEYDIDVEGDVGVESLGNYLRCQGSRSTAFQRCPLVTFTCLQAGLYTCMRFLPPACKPLTFDTPGDCARFIFQAADYCNCPRLIE